MLSKLFKKLRNLFKVPSGFVAGSLSLPKLQEPLDKLDELTDKLVSIKIAKNRLCDERTQAMYQELCAWIKPGDILVIAPGDINSFSPHDKKGIVAQLVPPNSSWAANSGMNQFKIVVEYVNGAEEIKWLHYFPDEIDLVVAMNPHLAELKEKWDELIEECQTKIDNLERVQNQDDV